MALTAGSRLGSYEIVAMIGAGGMGEVYRARDTRLQRDVAIKTLPSSVAADPDRLNRFEREALALAALNHPNIAHIHGVEEHAQGPALVMEFVDGPTLSSRIAEGGLGLEETLMMARQIADALEAAHEAGIIHRDLKPANIKLTGRGDAATSTVKVLDFGLAKAIDSARLGQSDVADSPTVSSPAMTRAGVVLGTAAYMSPEQARGGVVDKRADIWAFGCVLFEMLSGRAAFTGDSVADVIASVVKESPPWHELPAGIPVAIRRLLARCLEKNPRRRLHDIADARLEIEETIEKPTEIGGGSPAGAPAQKPRQRIREGIAWATAAVLTVVVCALLFASMPWPAGSTMPAQRTSLVHRGSSSRFVPGPPQISPDGRRVVYSAEDEGGFFRLWIRDLGAFEPRPLAGTERWGPGQNPFWSPDSRTIGFFADDQLKRVSADGGAVQSLGPIRWMGQGGAWSTTDTILYHPSENSPLLKISPTGGTPVPVTTLPAKGLWAHMWPSFLPDGRQFLFTARQYFQPFDRTESGIYLGSLDSPQVRRLLPDVSSARYVAPGYLLFARAGVLTAVPFDVATGVVGEPISLKERVTIDAEFYQASFSVSDLGVIALRQALDIEGLTQHRWVDRQGKPLSALGEARAYSFGTISPSGRRLAFAITDVASANSNIWIANSDGTNLQPFTSSPDFEGYPIWSRDDRRLTYLSVDENGYYLKSQAVQSGDATVLVKASTFMLPVAWSPDGADLLFARTDASGYLDLRVWSAGVGKDRDFLTRATAPFAGWAAFSPDGRWVAYGSSASSAPSETWAIRFPEATDKHRVVIDGALISWRDNGREILVLTTKQDVVALSTTVTAAGVTTGQRTVLVPGPTDFGPRIAGFPDHSKLMIASRIDPENGVAEIRLISGLIDDLRAGRLGGPR